MCPICSSTAYYIKGKPKTSPRVADLLNVGKYDVVQCENCKTYYVNPEIEFSIEEWKMLYGDNYFLPMTRWHKKSREKDRVNRFNHLVKYSDNKIKNFLDVGCGEGFCLLEAESRGWFANGIDIEDNRIDEAKRKSINFIKSDLTNAKFQSDFFDAIYMDSVLEHVVNPFEYLLEIRRIMKKGGILYIGIPNEDSLINFVKKIAYQILRVKTAPQLKPFQSPYHVVGFNMTSIHFTILNVNLKIKKIRNFACRTEFLKSKTFSQQFFKSLLLFPFSLMAAIIRKEAYIEAYIEK